MDWVEILERVRLGEDSYMEFKEEAVHPDDLAAGITALANSDGGMILIGVADDGQIPGIADLDRMAQKIDNVAYNNIEPPITLTVEKVSDGQSTVLVARVPKGPERPYRTNRGVYYVRTASGKRQATREELSRLYQASLDFFADELPVQKSTIEDLDVSAFGRFFEEQYQMPAGESGQELPRILTNLKLLSDGNLTLAGILLFGLNPQRFLPYAKISAVRFEGTQVSERIMDRKDMEGTLTDQLDDVESFLKIHMAQPGEIRDFRRQEDTVLPMEALREAVVNAVVHRDYSIRAQVKILIFEDRIEISSPGKLPNTQSIESMKAGVHVERNPILVTVLTKLGFMSQIGTGILRILRLMRERNLPEPDITADESQVKLVFWFGGR